jgi:hypothetical protein
MYAETLCTINAVGRLGSSAAVWRLPVFAVSASKSMLRWAAVGQNLPSVRSASVGAAHSAPKDDMLEDPGDCGRACLLSEPGVRLRNQVTMQLLAVGRDDEDAWRPRGLSVAPVGYQGMLDEMDGQMEERRRGERPGQGDCIGIEQGST